jgi:hypothetical protein
MLWIQYISWAWNLWFCHKEQFLSVLKFVYWLFFPKENVSNAIRLTFFAKTTKMSSPPIIMILQWLNVCGYGYFLFYFCFSKLHWLKLKCAFFISKALLYKHGEPSRGEMATRRSERGHVASVPRLRFMLRNTRGTIKSKKIQSRDVQVEQ